MNPFRISAAILAATTVAASLAAPAAALAEPMPAPSHDGRSRDFNEAKASSHTRALGQAIAAREPRAPR
jgi:hypothetical protein